MMTSWRGYTIIEVMIVLGVTGVLFVSAVAVFSGRADSTQFTQSIYDLQSQIQSYATEVSTGTFPATTSYSCAAAGSPSQPALTKLAGSQDQSTSQDCLYVGRALLAVQGSANIYAFSVLGLRDSHSGSTDTGNTATSLTQASPALAEVSGQYVLTNTYKLLPGVVVKSSNYFSTSINPLPAELLLLYTTFQNTGSSSQSMTAYTIPNLTSSTIGEPNADSNGNLADIPSLDACIESPTAPSAGLPAVPSGCITPTSVGGYGWRLCLQDSGTSRTAEITVLSSAAGINTTLKIGACA